MLGIGRGERVAIVSQNSARLLVALFGVSGYGRVVVPINFRLNADEVRYIVEQSGRLRVARRPRARRGPRRRRRARIGSCSAVSPTPALLRFDRQPNPWIDPSEDDVASINYTSGTTARPKGVELTHRNLYVNALTFGWHAGVSDRDVYLWAVPMFHCNGWGMVYAITGMGGRHVMLRKVDGPEILRRIDRARRHVHGRRAGRREHRPRRRRRAIRSAPGRDRIRIIVGGAPPPTAIIERVETELGWEFMQIYGLTETSPLLTLNRRRAEWDAADAHRAGAAPRSGRCAGDRCPRPRRRGRRGPGPRQRRLRAATGTSRRPPPRSSPTAGSAPATVAASTARAT